MTTRTTSKTIVFTRPFVLAGLDGAQPAGAFVVETNEERLEGVSFPAWRRHSTVIRLHPTPGLTLSATVDPEELNAALLQDSAPSEIALPEMRFESLVRRAYRSDKKIFLDTARRTKTASSDEEHPIHARREE